MTFRFLYSTVYDATAAAVGPGIGVLVIECLKKRRGRFVGDGVFHLPPVIGQERLRGHWPCDVGIRPCARLFDCKQELRAPEKFLPGFLGFLQKLGRVSTSARTSFVLTAFVIGFEASKADVFLRAGCLDHPVRRLPWHPLQRG